jgi:hypothetical protein
MGVALSGIHTIENIRRNYGLISVIEKVLGIFEMKLRIWTIVFPDRLQR